MLVSKEQVNWKPTRKLLRSVLGKSESEVLVAQWRHWEKYKGPEWTAKRMKAIWNIANLYRMAHVEQIVTVAADTRIALRSGVPKGMEGVLVKAYAEAKRPVVIRRYAAVLRSYTAITLSHGSEAQVDKARRSINTPGTSRDPVPPVRGVRGLWSKDRPSPQLWVVLTERFGWKPKHSGRTMGIVRGTDVPGFIPRLGKEDHPFKGWEPHIPSVNLLSGSSSYPGDIQLPRAVKRETPYASMMASLLTRGRIPESLRGYVHLETPVPLWDKGVTRKDRVTPALSDLSEFQAWAEANQERNHVPYWGKITVIQEPGAKGRIVCSPNAWVQLYFYPMHQKLARLISNMERALHTNGAGWYGRSCMFDQLFGVGPILDAVENHRFIEAVDLSSATDRFPLFLQQDVLRELGLPRYAEALEEVSGPYLGPDGQDWYYRAGQPMGLYGSFPLFHLTHFHLLRSLAMWLELPRDEVNFCVLGDDVVIFHPALAWLYKEVLQDLDVPVSASKCYSGDVVEFAGFMVVRSRNGATAFRPYKAREDGGFSSVLGICHALGVKVSEWSPWWAKSFQAYAGTKMARNWDLTPNQWFLSKELDAPFRNSQVGTRYLGSALSRVSYCDTVPICDWSSFREDWYTETILAQQREPFPGAFSDEGLVDQTTFKPVDYLKVERARKRAFVHGFSADPLVSEFLSNGAQ